MHTALQKRRQLFQHPRFHRADISQNRIIFQPRHNFFGQLLYDAERRVEEHNIGINHRFGGGVMHAVDKAKFKGLVACRSRARIARNMRRQFVFLQRMAERRTDKAEADKGNIGLAHLASPFLTFSNAAKAARLAACVPTLKRSICGKP